MLSRQLWRLALVEVPLDEEEWALQWGALVRFCNIYGSKPTAKSQESFSSYTDPHAQHPSTIPPSVHPYLNKLWCIRKQ